MGYSRINAYCRAALAGKTSCYQYIYEVLAAEGIEGWTVKMLHDTTGYSTTERRQLEDNEILNLGYPDSPTLCNRTIGNLWLYKFIKENI